MAAVRIAASSTVAASGPAWSSDQLCGTMPPRPIRPKVGLSPTQPQRLAGIRIDPPVSEPSAPAQSPAATAAPEPPLDPPGTRPEVARIARRRRLHAPSVFVHPASCRSERRRPRATARRRGVAHRRVETRRDGPRLGRHVHGQIVVLDGDRHAMKRPPPSALGDLPPGVFRGGWHGHSHARKAASRSSCAAIRSR